MDDQCYVMLNELLNFHFLQGVWHAVRTVDTSKSRRCWVRRLHPANKIRLRNKKKEENMFIDCSQRVNGMKYVCGR